MHGLAWVLLLVVLFEVSGLRITLSTDETLKGRLTVVDPKVVSEVAVLGEHLVAPVVQAGEQDAVLRGPSLSRPLNLEPTPRNPFKLILL